MSSDVLQAKIHKLKSPVMVGLDPSPALIPPSLIEGEGVAAMADAYERFCEGILEAVHGVAQAPGRRPFPLASEKLQRLFRVSARLRLGKDFVDRRSANIGLALAKTKVCKRKRL